MQRPISRIVRNWFAWLMAMVLVGSLAVRFITRPTLPSRILIGTAVRGGQYHEEGLRIAEALERRTGRDAEARRLDARAEEVRAAYRKAFVGDGSEIADATQTVYAQAIGFGLLALRYLLSLFGRIDRFSVQTGEE